MYQARKLHELAGAAPDRLHLIKTAQDLSAYVAQRQQQPELIAGILALEGMHALEGKLENLEKLYQTGFRMMAPTHFFDNEVGGSAHGVHKGGLTDFGKRAIKRMEELGIVVDMAHASPQTVDDILRLATRPVVSSHTGVKGTGAVCATEVRATARAMRYTADLIGVDHVALGSDFDGAITAPLDASEMAQVTAALLAEGFRADEIHKIMGGNVLRVMLAVLPPE